MPTRIGTCRSGAARYPVRMNDDSRFLHDLQRRQADGEHLRYLCFWGHQPPRMGVAASCFSQWYDAGFNIEGVHYPTAEHFMMAGKARLFGATDILEQVLASRTPDKVKALGRKIEGFDEALAYLRRMGVAKWRRPNASGSWGIVSAVRWASA